MASSLLRAKVSKLMMNRSGLEFIFQINIKSSLTDVLLTQNRQETATICMDSPLAVGTCFWILDVITNP